MSEDLVSIVMPSFNSAAFIDKSIDSVLAQTYKRFELIVVDDGSADDTGEVLRKYSVLDPRIKVIMFARNRGAAAARNAAIEEAKGRFIAFLDSDDSWSQDKLQIQIDAGREGRYPLSCTGYRMLRPDGKAKEVIPPRLISRRALLAGCDIGCLTAMMDLAVVGKKIYMRNIKMRQDYLLWIDSIQRGGQVLGIPDVLATLHMRGGSLSSNKASAAKHQWMAYRRELRLPLLKAGYYFSRYAFHGLRKHIF